MLLIAAINEKDAKKCTGVDINIKGAGSNIFVDRTDILETINSVRSGEPVGKRVSSFDLKEMEEVLQKNIWVKSAQLFFDNNERLQVNVLEREPVARIFTSFGGTFYIDSSITMLPLSEKFSARLPVFTGFPSDKKVLLKADSNLLRDILTVSTAMQNDSFALAMIEQIDITPQRTFEMVPKIGNTIIVFGSAKDAAEKFNKIGLFYKEVIVNAGWNKYSEVNVQYSNQVVAKRKEAAEVKADSLRTLELMQLIAATAEKMASDSVRTIVQDDENNTTNKNIIQQSIERDDNNTVGTNQEPQAPVENANLKPVLTTKPVTISKPVTLLAKKPVTVIKKPVATRPSNTNAKPAVKPVVKPKLVMPKKPANEY